MILAAILFPVFAKAREKARQTSCLSNLKQLGLGFAQYTQDNDEHLPGSGENVNSNAPTISANWVPPRPYAPHGGDPNSAVSANGANMPADVTLGAIYPYVKSTQVYICPDDPYASQRKLSYSMNEFLDDPTSTALNRSGISLAGVDSVSQVILLIDEVVTLNDGNFNLCGDVPSRIHTGGTNFAFMDGHTKWARPERLTLDPTANGSSGGYDPTVPYTVPSTIQGYNNCFIHIPQGN